ncbi:hypothetical protein V8G54_021745 [Vigna mungo]|uniref:DUF3741 domain-containing protein n=1 Tax=Vigna mungo TaxID=3915 RepID=A0AAQ3NDZ4_VIGMU
MESNEAASVILNLMDLDKVPNQHPVRDKQKVLSENYQQKVASIGVRRKRSSHQHHSFGMNTSEKDKSEDVLEVFKALRRSKHHNPSKGNGKENPSSSKNSQLADGLLQEICYPENQYRKQISCHMNFVKPSSRSFSKISEEISMQSGNVANGAFHTASTSFFRGNEVLANDMLKPASNISVNEIQFNSPIFCSDGSYIGSQARRKTLEQRDVTKKVHELRPFGRDCAHNQLHMIWEKGNGARNLTHQRGYGNVRIKAGDNYSFARRVPRPLCSASGLADNCGTMNQDILFHRYWGLRKNSSSSWSSWNSKNQNNDQKERLEDVNLSSGGEKFPSFCSYFNSDHTEENCISHKSEKGCYENNLSDKITMPHQLPSSSSSPTFIDRQILQERRVMNDEVKNRKYDDSNLFQQNVESLESSVEFLASDATVEVVDWTHSPTEHQSKSTAFILSQEIDCLNHTSYTSKQQVCSFLLKMIRITHFFQLDEYSINHLGVRICIFDGNMHELSIIE